MLTVSDEASDVMTSGGYVLRARVESWLDGELLDAGIPVAAGTESYDVTLNVPETLTLSVPRVYNGTSYVPGLAIDHPLAPWGQRLRVYLGVDVSTGTEWFGRGWFAVQDTRPDGDTVVVTAAGLLSLIDEAKFVAPVTATGTYASMLRRLVEPALTVDVSADLTDRSMPAGTTWDDGRLDAVYELLDAWPATAFVTEDGILSVVPVGDTSTSDLTLTDGTGGTAMRWSADTTREGAASCVVARGYDSTGADVQAVVYDTAPGSPTNYAGPFNPLPVPYTYFSPLLTTYAQCQAAASTVLARRKRQAARVLSTTAVPHLALQARDGVTVTASNLGVNAAFGIVDQLSLPLTVDNGSGVMTVGVRLP